MIDIPNPHPRVTMASLWEEYDRRAMPPQAGETQRRETRRAFYAGIMATLSEISTVAENHTLEDGSKVLDGWMAECAEFLKLIGEGKA
jgi:hypothetical protein